MARAFSRAGRAPERRYVAGLDADERDLVATLMEQVADLLDAPALTETGDRSFDAVVAGMSFDTDDGSAVPEAGAAPRDPALDRLLPNASPDDDEAATEFRRLTEGGLRQRKAAVLVGSAEVLRAADREVALDAEQAGSFLTALTDVRLVLGERLGLEAEEDLEALEARADAEDPAEPLAQALALYDFLTWLQETLATALLRD